MSIPSLKHIAGINFMGSHIMKSFSRDHTFWGWGNVIANFDLDLLCTITLPTYWTSDQPIDTALYMLNVSSIVVDGHLSSNHRI